MIVRTLTALALAVVSACAAPRPEPAAEAPEPPHRRLERIAPAGKAAAPPPTAHAEGAPPRGIPASPTGDDPTPRDPQAAPWLELSRPGLPNILWIFVDTVRRDHVGLYGYERDTTPAIDAFFEDAVIFEQFRTTGPATRFSVPPMLVGKHFCEIRRGWGNWPRIDDAEVLIQQRLQDAGYATAAVHSIEYYRERYGMARGWDHYDADCVEEGELWEQRRPGTMRCLWQVPTSDYVTDRALQMVDRDRFHQSGKPWFFWVYYSDPHGPYVNHDSVERFGGWYKDRYDAEIRFTDDQIGRLLEGLDERGLLRDTVVVFTSDHGEGLDKTEDHGHLLHTYGLYDELLRVPMMVRFPGAKGRRVHEPVSGVDIAPTFAELAGLPPLPHYRGVSLVPYLRGETPDRGPIYAERHRPGDASLKMMLRWPYKVILDMDRRRYRIYDLVTDPKEQRNLRWRHRMPQATRDALADEAWKWAESLDLAPGNPRN